MRNARQSCEDIIRLLNELLDGEITPERKEMAERLIRENPQCSTLFHTLRKTIDLYRMRNNEIRSEKQLVINWDQDIPQGS